MSKRVKQCATIKFLKGEKLEVSNIYRHLKVVCGDETLIEVLRVDWQ